MPAILRATTTRRGAPVDLYFFIQFEAMHNIIAQLLIVRSVAWPKDDVILALKIFDAEGYFAILSCVKSESQNSVRYLLAIAGLGGLLYGIDFGVIAAASPYIKALRLFSDAELSWIVGAVLFGGIVSSLTAGMLAERFGRKRMIVASAALFLVAIPTVCLSEKSLLPMLFGRVLQGVSAGYMAVVMPMYLTETLPPEIRGRGTGVFQFCLGLGLVAAAATGFVVARLYGAADAPAEVVADAAKSAAWKMNFWWTLAPVAALFLGSLRLPESPVWEKRVKFGSGGVRECGSEGVDSPTHTLTHALTLNSRKYVVPFLLAVAVLTLNKTTGMSSVTSYSVMIFQKAGFAGTLGACGQGGAHVAAEDRHRRDDDRPRRYRRRAARDRAVRARALDDDRDFLPRGVFRDAGVLRAWPRNLRVARPLRAYAVAHPRERNGDSALLKRWASMFFFFAANGVIYFIVSLLIPETKGKTLEELEHLFDAKSQSCKSC